MLQSPFPAQCTSALGDMTWGDVGTLPKQRNLKKTGLAVQANTVLAPLASSELPSQWPPAESSRKRDRHRKSCFKLILHMEKDTKIHQTASFRAGLSLLTFSSCLLTHPKDQPLAKPKPNKKQAQICSVIPLFFPFYPSWLCFHHPKCCPWAWGTCSGREKMNPLEMKLMWTGPSTGWILLCFTNGVSRSRGAKHQTQINTKSLSSWGNKTCTLGSLFSLSLLHRTQYFETLPFLFFWSTICPCVQAAKARAGFDILWGFLFKKSRKQQQ